MGKKFKRRRSTLLLKSTKQIDHFSPLFTENKKRARTYYVGNPDIGLKQAQKENEQFIFSEKIENYELKYYF